MRPWFAFATILTLAACGGRQPAPPTQHDHQTIPLGAATDTRVRLEMAAGELQVRGGAAGLLDADFEYNVPDWKPTIVHQTTAQPASLEISQGSASAGFSDTVNRWTLALNDTVPLDVIAHIGAGQARLTMGTLTLRHVKVEMGAGDLDLDLRGTPRASYAVDVQGGVGAATVHVPKTVAISATAAGALGSIGAEGLEQRDGKWVNPLVPSGPVTVTLSVKGGVGEIRLVAD